jgi:hypothetical protein
MVDTFYTGGYWSEGKDCLGSVVDKTMSFLEKLSKIDIQFANWYQLGYTKREALQRKVNLDQNYISNLYRSRIKKNDLDEDGFSKIGFSIDLWTGHEEDFSSSLAINCGHSSKNFKNSCVINIPIEGEAKDRLLSIDKQKEIFHLLIDEWHPQNIIVNSKSLSGITQMPNEIGWMTYIKELKKIPDFKSKIIRKHFNGGHLFYLETKNSFCYDYDLMEELLPLRAVI